MLRREFVAVLTAVTAGCLENGGGETENNGEGNETDQTNGDEERFPQVGDGDVVDEVTGFGREEREASVVDTETGYTVAGFSVDDEPVRSVAYLTENDGNGPPTVQTRVANTDGTAAAVSLNELPPYGGVGEGDGIVLYAVPTEAHDLTDESPALETDNGAWHLDNGHEGWLPDIVEIDSDSGYSGEYALVTEDEALSEGIYVFDSGFSLSVWRTGEPGPSEPSRFEGDGFPDYETPEETVEMSWYHETDETSEVYLEPSEEYVEPPTTVGFELVNRSGRAIIARNLGWSLYKLVDDDWSVVAGEFSGRTDTAIWPGETVESEITVPDEEADDDEDRRDVGPLGGGIYAYDENTDVDGERPASVFEVDAPPVDVEPPSDAEAERDTGEVFVTSENGDVEFTVERTEAEPDWTVAPEGLYGVERPSASGSVAVTGVAPEGLYGVEYGLRYVFPFFREETERITVKADEDTVDSVFVFDDERTLRYEGESYLATR